MRPRTVAPAVLTAVVALVALPGLAGSRPSSLDRDFDPAAFQVITIDANRSGSATAIRPLDPAARSANALGPLDPFLEPDRELAVPAARASAKQPSVRPGSTIKAARYSLRGYATWYDNGTTAARLPRGTIIRVCGAAGCVERVVNDYGPQHPSRVVDLMPSDFARVCGCSIGTGVAWVRVDVY